MSCGQVRSVPRGHTGTWRGSHAKWVCGEDASSLFLFFLVSALKQRREDNKQFGRGIWMWGRPLCVRASVAPHPRAFPARAPRSRRQEARVSLWEGYVKCPAHRHETRQAAGLPIPSFALGACGSRSFPALHKSKRGRGWVRGKGTAVAWTWRGGVTPRT